MLKEGFITHLLSLQGLMLYAASSSDRDMYEGGKVFRYLFYFVDTSCCSNLCEAENQYVDQYVWALALGEMLCYESDSFSPKVHYGTDKILDFFSLLQQIFRCDMQSGNAATIKGKRIPGNPDSSGILHPCLSCQGFVFVVVVFLIFFLFSFPLIACLGVSQQYPGIYASVKPVRVMWLIFLTVFQMYTLFLRLPK